MDASGRIRVLQLVNGEYWSGAERVQALLGTYADPKAVTLKYLCLKDGLFAERAAHLNLHVSHCRMRFRGDLSVAWSIAQQVRREHIDVLHTHTVRTNLVGRVVRMLTGVPVVTHVHSPSLQETENWAKNRVNTMVDQFMDRLTDVSIAVSRSLADGLVKAGIPPSKVVVIPNGIDVRAYHPGVGRGDVRREFGISPDALVVAMVGLFRPRKGAERLIEAFSGVLAEMPTAYLMMIGPATTTEYLDGLRTACRRWGIEQRTIFTGFRSDVANLLPAFDVLAMPSLFGEGTPMALLEAMAAGLPVVATPVEGISDVVVDGKSGLLVPVDDTEALTRALINLLSQPEVRHSLGRSARERVESGYSAERMTRAVEDVYRRVLLERGIDVPLPSATAEKVSS